MTKKIKSIISIILSLVLCFTLTLNFTFAETSSTKSISFNNNSINKATDIELKKTKVKFNEKNTKEEPSNSEAVYSVQPTAVEWLNVINYESYDFANNDSFKNTADGGFICGATTGTSLIWLTKTASDGSIEWSYAYGEGSSWTVNAVDVTSDNGYVITGKLNDDAFLIKFDSLGNVEWFQLFGGSLLDEGNDVVQTSDSGYFIMGTSKSFGNGHYEAYLIKTDASGIGEWAGTLPNTTRDEFGVQALVNSSTGNIVTMMESHELNTTTTTFLQISNTGSITQSKSYDNIMQFGPTHMSLTSDNGLILTGKVNEYINGDYVGKVSLAKLNSLFNVSWQNSYFVNGYDDYQSGECVTQTNDGGYIATAIISYYDTTAQKSFRDIGLIKVSSSGVTEWMQTYNLGELDYTFYVHQTSDSGYVVSGKTQDYGTDTDIFTFKLN